MIDLIKQGIDCADNQNAIENMKQLRETAKNGKIRSDYVAFMQSVMPIDIEEAEDGCPHR